MMPPSQQRAQSVTLTLMVRPIRRDDLTWHGRYRDNHRTQRDVQRPRLRRAGGVEPAWLAHLLVLAVELRWFRQQERASGG